MNKSGLIAVLIILLFQLKGTAQELHYDHFTTREGLLQMQVTALFQDSKGHLWVGTKLGASRFDGKHFTNFTIQDGLPESFVDNISEDSAGRILLLTRGGLAIYDGSAISGFPSEIFKSRMSLFPPVVKQGDSIFIYLTNQYNQLEGYYFDGKTYLLMETYFDPNPLSNDKFANELITIIYDFPSNTLYAGSGKWGIHAIRAGKMKKIADAFEAVESFARGVDGELYVCFDAQFGRITGDEIHLIPSEGIPQALLENKSFAVDRDGRIIYRENKNQKLVILEKERVFKETFDHGIIIEMLVDREGNLWLGSEKGLFRNTSRAILNFIPRPGGISDYIWSVSEDKHGNMLFGAYDKGLQMYHDGQFKSMERYRSQTNLNIPHQFYMGSLRAKSGDVYLPVTFRTLLRYDGTKFFQAIKSEKFNTAFYVYEDPNDASIYVGTSLGLFRLLNGVQEHWDVQPGNGKSKSITSVVKDRSGRIWIAGFNGISLLQNNEIRHLPYAEMSFPHGGNALLRDSLDNIWIGNPQGLFFYNYESFLKIEHPKLDKLVLSLAMVGDSAMLIGTISDLLMFNVKTFYQTGEVSIMSIGPDKGYHAIEPGQNGFYRDTKGYYWLTNSDRVVRIDPAQLHLNTIPPEVYIGTVSLMDEKMNWNPLERDQMYHPVFYYAKDEKNIRFDITAVSLRDPDGVTYSHFLEGYDKGWSSPDHESDAVYTNLQPGEYSLFYKAANTDGVWSKEHVYKFTIKPIFYQTIWFKVSGILLAAAILFFGGVGLTNERRKKQLAFQENERKIAEFQLLSIKNQIDPHFTYNAINSIAAAVLKEEKNVAYTYFVKLSQLMRSILQNNDKLTRSLESEISFVRDYLDIQHFRFREHFSYSIEIPSTIDMQMEVPRMCIQTFAENALKHGLMHKTSPGFLQITLLKEQKCLKICIEDDGIGRARALELKTAGTGMGLNILQRYTDHFNEQNQKKISWQITDLIDDKGHATGTHVDLIIPDGFSYRHHLKQS
ncbi:MAG: signal transduction histidine kinase LytS [Bacteroidetes bacterium]|nr:MAG: signal transduction histidine kinase LytS [Bacteroidota bacterium]